MPPCPPHSSHRPLLAQQAVPQRVGALNPAFPGPHPGPQASEAPPKPSPKTLRRALPGGGSVPGYTSDGVRSVTALLSSLLTCLRDPSSPTSICRLEFALRQNHRTPAFSGTAASKPCPVHCKHAPLPSRQLLSFDMEKSFSSSLLL